MAGITGNLINFSEVLGRGVQNMDCVANTSLDNLFVDWTGKHHTIIETGRHETNGDT